MRRPNPVFSDEYRALVRVLVETRIAAGLSQRALAARLGRSPSHIALIERGQRRVDALELRELARCFAIAPEELYGRMCAAVDLLETDNPPLSWRNAVRRAAAG